MGPVIDGEKLLDDLDNLAQIGVDPKGGLSRIAYNSADRQGRNWVAVQMKAVGMTPRTDAVGNGIGLYPGTDVDLLPIALGSHTDTVPNGGRFDGSLGVLAALACVRALYEANIQLRHPVEVINFAAEEATMSGATLGSRAMSGLLDVEVAVNQLAWDGRPTADHLREAGLDPAIIDQAQRTAGSLAAYLELHIEQGGRLESGQIPVGVVEGIVGIRRYTIIFSGYANHAGTTPMRGRQDALVMAAPFISSVPEVVISHDIVGTIGTLRIEPGAPNVIPGRVEMGLEIRGLDEAVLDETEVELARFAEKDGAEFRQVSKKTSTVSDPRLTNALAAACDELGLPFQRMPSGAGHDAMCMAAIAPQAMLFVPSRGGVSHSPDEFTKPEDCVTGARVLLATLLRLDVDLDP